MFRIRAFADSIGMVSIIKVPLERTQWSAFQAISQEKRKHALHNMYGIGNWGTASNQMYLYDDYRTMYVGRSMFANEPLILIQCLSVPLLLLLLSLRLLSNSPFVCVGR